MLAFFSVSNRFQIGDSSCIKLALILFVLRASYVNKYSTLTRKCCNQTQTSLTFIVPRKLLKRLLEEFNDLLKKKTSVEQQPVQSEEIRELIAGLTETLKKITEGGYRAIIVIDALNKVDESGQTTKVIFLILA